jgi:hypothetical protein
MEDKLRVELTLDEQQILRDVLWEYLSDLRMEIADTEAQDFREDLKRREAFLKDLLRRLGEKL